MKAVFEEVNGNQAVFVLDDYPAVFHLDVSDLPEDVVIGDVFSVCVVDGTFQLDQKLAAERTARKETVKAKREMLLRRTKEME